MEITSTHPSYQRAVDSITTRDEFLAIVSHDLKNPLGAVSACATMLLEEFEHSPPVRKWIEFIRRNIETSLRMISDLLDVERISQNKMQITLISHSISLVIRNTCETFLLAARNKGIALQVSQVDENLFVHCDPDRIGQVLANLLNNAIKYTPENGTVTVETERRRAAVNISVCDTGAGIPAEKMQTIFDKFAQLPSSDRTGLGLGLYIAKNIVEAHGSKLHVESAAALGTKFSFELPVPPSFESEIK